MQKKSSRRRLSDDDLAFLENVRAGACGIIQDVKALSYWIDDPDQLSIALKIMEKAQRIRDRTIEREDELKEEKIRHEVGQANRRD